MKKFAILVHLLLIVLVLMIWGAYQESRTYTELTSSGHVYGVRIIGTLDSCENDNGIQIININVGADKIIKCKTNGQKVIYNSEKEVDITEVPIGSVLQVYSEYGTREIINPSTTVFDTQWISFIE